MTTKRTRLLDAPGISTGEGAILTRLALKKAGSGEPIRRLRLQYRNAETKHARREIADKLRDARAFARVANAYVQVRTLKSSWEFA